MNLPSTIAVIKIACAVCAVLIGLLAFKQVQLSSVRADKALADSAYAICKSNNAALTATIDAQNLAVQELSDKARTLEAKAQDLAREALKKRQQQRIEAATVKGTGAEVMNSWLKSTFSQ